MIFKRQFVYYAVWAFLLMALGLPPLQAAPSHAPRPIIYRFSENLLGAEAVNITEDGEVTGKWREESFLFKGQGEEAAIKVDSKEVNGVPQEVIFFNPLEKVNRRLRFSAVPGGSRLALEYFTQKDPKLKQVTYLYLSIWVGRHLVKKLPIVVSEDGWKQFNVDLGILPFLHTDTTFTFELSGQGVHNLQFAFSAILEA